MDNAMFCYQCEQTVGGKGCTKMGVCGKTPEIANLQDLLIYQLKGISCYAMNLIDKGELIDKSVVAFVEDSLFTTLTNVNFDPDFHVQLLKQSHQIKEELRKKVDTNVKYPEYSTYQLPGTKSEMLEDSVRAGIMYDQTLDADIRSLRMTIIYGLKGISAYGHQARFLGYHDDEVDQFYFKGLACTTDDTVSQEQLIEMVMKTGNMSILVMKILDEANTTTYMNPSAHKVNVKNVKGPFIIVSGHDLHDLEMLLEQTEGKGINIYTHGEMLPSHGYPRLKKFKHLVGNFGGAWQEQQREFDNIPGCILMTTNCLMRPRESYKDRIFTTNVVGYEGLINIPKLDDGTKDFVTSS